MTDDLLENAIVAAQDQYGDPPAKYAPGNNMPDSVTVAVHHQRATFNGVPLVDARGHRLLEENRSVLPAISPTRRRCGAFSSASRSNTARRAECG
jgi:hypothetical protein